MDKTPRNPTQAAMSGVVSAITAGLSTRQGDGFLFRSRPAHISIGYARRRLSDSQQYAMTQHSQLIQRTSSAAEHGDPGATAISTNVQSSTVQAAVFNHGMVTPGQSFASCDGFIDGQIVSKPMFSATWNTYSVAPVTSSKYWFTWNEAALLGAEGSKPAPTRSQVRHSVHLRLIGLADILTAAAVTALSSK
ncbi:hypothetical protein ARSEF4850_003036 [Beauveria asiatica]